MTVKGTLAYLSEELETASETPSNNPADRRRYDENGPRQAALIPRADLGAFDENAPLINGAYERGDECAERRLRYVLSGARCLLWEASIIYREETQSFDWDLCISNEDAAQQFLQIRLIPFASYAKAWGHSIPAEDLAAMRIRSADAFRAGLTQYSQEFRCRDRNDHLHWLHEDVRVEAAGPKQWSAVGVVTEITERKESEALLQAQNNALELLATGAAMDTVLGALNLAAEQLFPGALSSILRYDTATRCVYPLSAPSLPAPFLDLLDGFKVSPTVSSCGAAIARRAPVIVEDIQTDPLWADLQAIADAYQLRSVWSHPILARDGAPLGLFAIYRRVPHCPSQRELDLIASSARLAGVAIEQKRGEAALQSSERRFRALTERASDIVSVLSSTGVILFQSAAVENVLGWRPNETAGRNISEFVHPEDLTASAAERERRVGNLDICGVPIVARLLHKNGEYRVAESIASDMRDDPDIGGFVVHTRDVTDREKAEKAREAALLAMRRSEERNRAIVEQSNDGIFLVDPATRRIREGNRAFLEMTGYQTEDLSSLMLDDIVVHDLAEVYGNVAATVEKGRHTLGERQYRRKDGSLIEVEVSAVMISAFGGDALSVTVRDITARNENERHLRHIATGALCLLWYADVEANEDAPGAFIWRRRLFDEEGAFRFLSLACAPDESFLDASWRSISADDREKMNKNAGKALEENLPGYWNEYQCRDRYGVVRWLQEDVRLEQVAPGRWRAIGLTSNVTARKEAEMERENALIELAASRERYRNLFQNIPTGVYRTTPDGRILMANPALVRMLGYETVEQITQINLETERPHASYTRNEFRARLEREGEVRGWESLWARRDGSPIHIRESARTVRDANGAIICYEGTIEDISERKRAEDIIRKQAYHDNLTDLPNRVLFGERLERTLSQSRRSDEMAAVLFMDLDRFKQINDTLGHAAGDKLLKEVARRLLRTVGADDTVARMGGDEFTVLLPGITSPRDGARMAQKIKRILSRPLTLDGHDLYVAASVGIAVFPFDGQDADTLVKHADVAMYRAKEQGGDDYQMYTRAMNATSLQRLVMEASLRKALARDEFTLLFQPQFDMATGRIDGAEALVRWNHPELGQLKPAQFIPLAEETGLISPLGEWILREACRHGARWMQAGTPLRVSVNISARQFAQRDLAERVDTILRETGFDGKLLDMELTESALLEQGKGALETLASLKELGLRLSVDDFGTGYSSLMYLRQFPIDVLKVDQSFVQGMTTRSEDAAIVRAVIDLAHALGLRVVAEGVETTDQREQLAVLGCDALQGYLFSAPVPADAFYNLTVCESGSA